MRDEYQSVLITLSDGTIGRFTGEVLVRAHEIRNLIVADVKFTEPQELPEGCSFKMLKEI